MYIFGGHVNKFGCIFVYFSKVSLLTILSFVWLRRKIKFKKKTTIYKSVTNLQRTVSMQQLGSIAGVATTDIPSAAGRVCLLPAIVWRVDRYFSFFLLFRFVRGARADLFHDFRTDLPKKRKNIITNHIRRNHTIIMHGRAIRKTGSPSYSTTTR